LEGVVRAERERNEKLMEMHEKMLGEFQTTQQKFFEYTQQKPEKPIYKPENVRETIENARRELGVDVVNFYNFAFAGQAKRGKSSLINAFRGMNKNDLGAAEVDVTECTQVVKFYTFPEDQMPFVRLYDIPGAGTLSHNAESYFNDKGLCAFDCLLIFVQATLSQDEIKFAQSALHYRQSVAFVRSRCDEDMQNKLLDEEIDAINQETVCEYVATMGRIFQKEIDTKVPELSNVPCYFVSSRALLKLMRGQEDGIFYQESKLLEYVMLQSKHSRNIV